MVVLVDTSVWILHLRQRRFDVNEILGPHHKAAICLPVFQEILQGVRGVDTYLQTRTALLSFPMVQPEMSLDVFEEAARIYRVAREGGYTVRSSNDLLIAACALINDLPLVHVDRDFTAIARVTALRAHHLGN